MKLATVVVDGKTRVGVVEGDRVSLLPVEGGMLELVEDGAGTVKPSHAANGHSLPLNAVQLQAPLQNPSKVVCIGLNYADYAEAGGFTPPTRPLCFAKFPSSIVGPGAEVAWSPSLTAQVDYEAELVVVMGKKARHVSKHDALDYIFGYTCGNDISARDLQNSDGQWVRSKSLDTFAPLGPWIVTADEIADPQQLKIRCAVNRQWVQDSSTGRMIFGIADLIEFLSQAFTLLPGDLIFTGTPAGVGIFRNPPLFLQEGDEVTVEIEGIGTLVNRCRTFEERGGTSPL